jgi:hypothetical protein
MQKKIVVYDIRNKPKVFNIFWHDSYDKLSRWNAKFGKIYTLWKVHIYSTMIKTNMWSIGPTICIFNNKLQKISFKKHFIWKSEKGLKMTKMDSQSFCKVISLAPIYVLAPKRLCWNLFIKNSILVNLNKVAKEAKGAYFLLIFPIKEIVISYSEILFLKKKMF